MEHASHLARPFPWRAVTFVAVGVAVLELVGLIVSGALLLARPIHRGAVAKVSARATPVRRPAAAVPRVRVVHSHPLRTRSRMSVVVMNGNGVQGAASTEAARLQSLGYRIGAAENATRHDYARSMVMYVPGWAKEARRLARDTGIRLVAPVDGITPARLKRSQLIVLLGS